MLTAPTPAGAAGSAPPWSDAAGALECVSRFASPCIATFRYLGLGRIEPHNEDRNVVGGLAFIGPLE